MTVEGELGFLGGATFYQGETKVHLMVRRYFANDERGLVNRWWGTYVDAPEESLASGDAYARFSDGSEAEINIETDDATSGRFIASSPLADSTERLLRAMTAATRQAATPPE
jgi:hypothetical protein